MAHPRENEHPPNTGQVGTKWSKIGVPLISPDYCLLPHCQKSAGWWSAIGAQPLIHLGPDSHDCVLFLSQAPAARNKSKRGSWQCESNLFSICCQDAVFHSEMKSDSEIWIQWTALPSGSNDYNDRNGNVFFPFESGDLTMQRMEKLRVVEYKSYILIPVRRVSLSGDQSVSALRAWRISHWERLMTSQMHSGTCHRSPQSSAYPVSSVRVISSAHWAL